MNGTNVKLKTFLNFFFFNVTNIIFFKMPYCDSMVKNNNCSNCTVMGFYWHEYSQTVKKRTFASPSWNFLIVGLRVETVKCRGKFRLFLASSKKKNWQLLAREKGQTTRSKEKKQKIQEEVIQMNRENTENR